MRNELTFEKIHPGPFVLTRACDTYPRPQEITILPSDLLYPLDHFLQPATEGAKGDDANGPYAIHYWAGTWWRDAVITNARRRIIEARTANASGEDR